MLTEEESRRVKEIQSKENPTEEEIDWLFSLVSPEGLAAESETETLGASQHKKETISNKIRGKYGK